MAAISRLEDLQRQLFIKQTGFAACRNGFYTAIYKKSQFDAELDFAKNFIHSTETEAVPDGVPHPERYSQLLQYRQKIADKHGISKRAVLTTESLRQLVDHLPMTQKSNGRIRGIARKRLERYGKDIESIIRTYCDANQIQHVQTADEGPLQLDTTSDTKKISLLMFEAGKTIEQIADQRRLTKSTIQGHLAYFIQENLLDIHRLLAEEKLEEIRTFYKNNPSATLSETKTQLGSKFDYGELRLGLSYFRSQQS